MTEQITYEQATQLNKDVVEIIQTFDIMCITARDIILGKNIVAGQSESFRLGFLLEYIMREQSKASLLTDVFNDKYGDEFYLPEIG